MSEERKRTQEMIRSLKQQRDELALKIHLAESEAQEEWGRLDDQLNQLSNRLDPLKGAARESADDVWESLKLTGEEIKRGFERIRKSL